MSFGQYQYQYPQVTNHQPRDQKQQLTQTTILITFTQIKCNFTLVTENTAWMLFGIHTKPKANWTISISISSQMKKYQENICFNIEIRFTSYLIGKRITVI